MSQYIRISDWELISFKIKELRWSYLAMINRLQVMYDCKLDLKLDFWLQVMYEMTAARVGPKHSMIEH